MVVCWLLFKAAHGWVNQCTLRASLSHNILWGSVIWALLVSSALAVISVLRELMFILLDGSQKEVFVEHLNFLAHRMFSVCVPGQLWALLCRHWYFADVKVVFLWILLPTVSNWLLSINWSFNLIRQPCKWLAVVVLDPFDGLLVCFPFVNLLCNELLDVKALFLTLSQLFSVGFVQVLWNLFAPQSQLFPEPLFQLFQLVTFCLYTTWVSWNLSYDVKLVVLVFFHRFNYGPFVLFLQLFYLSFLIINYL
mgnify:CR=1 FL=1